MRRQFVLALDADERVLIRNRAAGVAGDLAGLDGGGADLLPPPDVGRRMECDPKPTR